MKIKEHDLKTMQEVFDVVNKENVHRFLHDFVEFALYAVNAKEEMPYLNVHSMKWKDDGKHKITGIEVKFNVK